jgi:hypothetical protein
VTVARVPAVPALAAPGPKAVGEDVSIAAIGRSQALELELLPALAQLPRGRRLRLVPARQLIEERPQPALPVDERAVAVEGGDFDLSLCDPSALLH